MKAISLTKEVLYKIDFFNSVELLRYKGQPEYRTLTGGFLSLTILITILATFTSLIISTFAQINISASQLNTQDNDPSESIVTTNPGSMFMFGVQVWHHDLNTGDRYFDVLLRNRWLNTGMDTNQTIQIPLEQCRKEHWASYPKVLAEYDRLQMNYWLCPPMNTSFSVKGKFASVLSKTLEVSVRKCKNATDPTRPCANQSTIDAYFADQQQLFYTIYFMNPLVNPSQADYIDVYLEDNNYIIFTQNFGSEGILFLSDYQVTTDLSIWPFTDNLVESGSRVKQYAIKNPYTLTVDNDVYCFFSFYKGATQTVSTRSFTKIGDTLSYIGGLFGAITTILMVFSAYNGHSFEITLGAYLFKPNDKDDNYLKKFNFLKFVAYSFYGIFKSLKLCSCWTSMNKYLDSRKVMLKELDILYLLERVQFLERSFNTIFSDHQFKGLHLQDKFTMEQAKKNRMHYDLKDSVLNKIKQIKQKKKKMMPETNIELNSHENTLDNGFDDIRVYPEKPEGKMQSILNKIMDMSSESSSEADPLEEFQLAKDLQRLREEAEDGCITSKRIWQGINEEITHNLGHFRKKDFVTPSNIDNEQEKTEKPENYQINNTFEQSDQCIFLENSLQNNQFEKVDFIKKNPKEILKMKKLIQQDNAQVQRHGETISEQRSAMSKNKQFNPLNTVYYGEKKQKNGTNNSMFSLHQEKEKKNKSKKIKTKVQDQEMEQDF